MTFLPTEDVARLTGKVRFAAQRRALDALGIKYLRAASGEPLVRPGDLDAAGRPAHRNRPGHRWEMIGPVASIRPIRPR